MIAGIGIDILRADRIRSAIERYGERFTRRVFTCTELEYCRSKKNAYESLAARFAVKEAAFKALGRGWDECGGFTAVEVVTGNGGRPEIVFCGKARKIADSIGVSRAFVTITHDSGISAAVVILEKQV
ncbi:holo-ACP synthase [bacterium]|nr:holo-ACP synthase [bacterium]